MNKHFKTVSKLFFIKNKVFHELLFIMPFKLNSIFIINSKINL